MFKFENAKVGNVVEIDLDNDGKFDEDGYILRVNQNYADVAFLEFDGVTIRLDNDNSENFNKLSETIFGYIYFRLTLGFEEEAKEERWDIFKRNEKERELEKYIKDLEKSFLSQAI